MPALPAGQFTHCVLSEPGAEPASQVAQRPSAEIVLPVHGTQPSEATFGSSPDGHWEHVVRIELT
eukprot:COSAG02_NODE_14705_length_1245_cov_0.808901_1_plen_64_part_10